MIKIKIDTEHPELEELKKYYEAQANVAKLPKETRVIGVIGATREISVGENVEANAIFISVVAPTLKN